MDTSWLLGVKYTPIVEWDVGQRNPAVEINRLRKLRVSREDNPPQLLDYMLASVAERSCQFELVRSRFLRFGRLRWHHSSLFPRRRESGITLWT